MDGQPEETFDSDDLETRRSTIRQSLDEIVNHVSIAMRDAHLDFPLALTIPSAGHAFIWMMTPGDPSVEEWEQASAIVRKIVGEKLGDIRLRSKHLPCAMVNATMAAADILPNTLSFEIRL